MLGETRPFLVEDWPRLSSCARTFQLETAEGRGECVDRQRDGGGGPKRGGVSSRKNGWKYFTEKRKRKCVPHIPRKKVFSFKSNKKKEKKGNQNGFFFSLSSRLIVYAV